MLSGSAFDTCDCVSESDFVLADEFEFHSDSEFETDSCLESEPEIVDEEINRETEIEERLQDVQNRKILRRYLIQQCSMRMGRWKLRHSIRGLIEASPISLLPIPGILLTLESSSKSPEEAHYHSVCLDSNSNALVQINKQNRSQDIAATDREQEGEVEVERPSGQVEAHTAMDTSEQNEAHKMKYETRPDQRKYPL